MGLALSGRQLRAIGVTPRKPRVIVTLLLLRQVVTRQIVTQLARGLF